MAMFFIEHLGWTSELSQILDNWLFRLWGLGLKLVAGAAILFVIYEIVVRIAPLEFLKSEKIRGLPFWIGIVGVICIAISIFFGKGGTISLVDGPGISEENALSTESFSEEKPRTMSESEVQTAAQKYNTMMVRVYGSEFYIFSRQYNSIESLKQEVALLYHSQEGMKVFLIDDYADNDVYESVVKVFRDFDVHYQEEQAKEGAI